MFPCPILQRKVCSYAARVCVHDEAEGEIFFSRDARYSDPFVETRSKAGKVVSSLEFSSRSRDSVIVDQIFNDWNAPRS